MMKSQDFKKIDDFFHEKKRESKLAVHAYKLFVANVDSAIESETNNNPKKNVSEAKIRSICDQYLTDQLLENYYIIAKKNTETEKNQKGDTVNWASFFGSIVASLVANILFLLILYLFFIGLQAPSTPKQINESLNATKTDTNNEVKIENIKGD